MRAPLHSGPRSSSLRVVKRGHKTRREEAAKDPGEVASEVQTLILRDSIGQEARTQKEEAIVDCSPSLLHSDRCHHQKIDPVMPPRKKEHRDEGSR